MSYHRFPNIGEILQGGMVGKLREGIGSKYLLNMNATVAPQQK